MNEIALSSLGASRIRLTTFAVNIMETFLVQPTHSVGEPMVARMAGAQL
jgi:hypothetical protein